MVHTTVKEPGANTSMRWRVVVVPSEVSYGLVGLCAEIYLLLVIPEIPLPFHFMRSYHPAQLVFLQKRLNNASPTDPLPPNILAKMTGLTDICSRAPESHLRPTPCRIPLSLAPSRPTTPPACPPSGLSDPPTIGHRILCRLERRASRSG